MKPLQLLASALSLQALGLAEAKPVKSKPVKVEPGRLPSTYASKHLRPVLERRQRTGQSGFAQGQPISSNGRGAPFSGGTNRELDLQNPSNLGAESTDNGLVVNLKWAFSDSKTRLLNGGWVREQVVTDLPSSHDIAGAQQHLKRGAIRELHWHRVAEWGYVYAGRVSISAVDEEGRNTYEELGVGDIWYFPKGEAHAIQGLDEENEYLLVFDDGDFDATGTTFMVDDWISHTPKDILAKNFGVNASVFDDVPSPNPYIINSTVSDEGIDSPYGRLEGNGSYIFYNSQATPIEAPGGGGSISIVDSRNFPISTTIAAAIVTLRPGALRELHWHPNAEEWIYFVSGQARATAFIGGANARTFDFSAGDTAVFPDNSGHYVENSSEDEDLVWIEIYKSDRVVDISLTQWLALTPVPIAARVLNVSPDVIRNLRKEKQLIIA